MKRNLKKATDNKSTVIQFSLFLFLVLMLFFASSTPTYAATPIKFTKSTVQMKKGGTYTLKVSGSKKVKKTIKYKKGKKTYKKKVTYYYYKGKKITFSTSNSKVATVNKTTGYITAKKAGTCYVTAKIGNAKGKCKIVVTNKSNNSSNMTINDDDVEYITIMQDGNPISAGDVVYALSDFNPIYKSNMYLKVNKKIVDCVIISSDPSVISVEKTNNKSWTLTYLKHGSATISIIYNKKTYNLTYNNSYSIGDYMTEIREKYNITNVTSPQYIAYVVAAYMCDTIEYGYPHMPYCDGRDLKSALFYHKAVCGGYTLAYQAILQNFGLECVSMAVVNNELNHAWNQVKIDGNWYMVDVTWMDTKKNGSYNLKYFLTTGDIYKNIRDKYNLHPSDNRFDLKYNEYKKTNFENPWENGAWVNF